METPHGQDMATLSNIGHWIEGGILLAVAVFAFLEVRGLLRTGKARFIGPAFILLTGVLLGPFLLLHHGIEAASRIWADGQQQQHTIMGFMILGGGVAELVGKIRGWPRAGVLFGAVISVVGVMFLIHEQHGTADAITWAILYHRVLGAVLIAAGAARMAYAWGRLSRPVVGYVSVAALLAAALMLVTYREPEGAYAAHGGHGQGEPSAPAQGAPHSMPANTHSDTHGKH